MKHADSNNSNKGGQYDKVPVNYSDTVYICHISTSFAKINVIPLVSVEIHHDVHDDSRGEYHQTKFDVRIHLRFIIVHIHVIISKNDTYIDRCQYC